MHLRRKRRHFVFFATRVFFVEFLLKICQKIEIVINGDSAAHQVPFQDHVHAVDQDREHAHGGLDHAPAIVTGAVTRMSTTKTKTLVVQIIVYFETQTAVTQELLLHDYLWEIWQPIKSRGKRSLIYL